MQQTVQFDWLIFPKTKKSPAHCAGDERGRLSQTAVPQVPVVALDDVAEEGDAQHRIRRDPRHGVSGAEGVEGHGRCIGADGAAGKQPRQHQTHGDTRHQLCRACAQHEAAAPDALHAVAHHKDEAQKQVHGEVHIQQ